jgi:RNA polymerase sigma-70 factor, ECF subfamily
MRVSDTNQAKGVKGSLKSISSSDAARMLFEQYGDEVYRYIRFTIGDQAESQDVLQEVFLRVLQSWGRFQHKSSPRTWLYAIANNCIKESLRKRKRDYDRLEFNEEIEVAKANDLAMELALEQSLESLTLSQRQVFVERVIHEKSSPETAETLGWSEAKVRTTLHRAIKNIQVWFAKEGKLK